MNVAPSPPDLVGQSAIFLDALAHASAIAPIDRPVLIIGERGTGKELLAARIHFLSLRWDGPLVKLNCAAMNEDLLESELFGHEAGAFTGASKKHRGRFERANGGTLFLDEIASASARVQEKLLRVIEYGEFERMGGEQTLKADTRIVAAANIDLRAEAKAGNFRADLLDRLAFDVVAAPPLRDRREDISVLAAHFASGFAAQLSTHFPGFSPEATTALIAHSWPGNVRELKNVAERAMFRHFHAETDGPINAHAVIIDPFPNLYEEPAPLQAAPAPLSRDLETKSFDLRAHLDIVERQATIDALEKSSGNQKRAAQSLSLSYDQLRGILRKHKIDAGEFR